MSSLSKIAECPQKGAWSLILQKQLPLVFFQGFGRLANKALKSSSLRCWKAVFAKPNLLIWKKTSANFVFQSNESWCCLITLINLQNEHESKFAYNSHEQDPFGVAYVVGGLG